MKDGKPWHRVLVSSGAFRATRRPPRPTVDDLAAGVICLAVIVVAILIGFRIYP